ncbi:MAG: efflux RND transporter periplasmic adaptor subunit [Deltaproteobacteria bacterium]|nr:efflux RND transporter periplasmic adaptor subunit [Deltaproteobacteria bacterium]
MTTAAVSSPPAKKQILVTLAIVGAVILVLGFIKYIQISRAIAASQAFGPPPEAITSIVVEEAVWPRTLSSIGSISPEQGVTLSAEEPGKVSRVAFESGAEVKAGDVLVELDTSVEQANLAAALAKAEGTRRDLARAQRLRSTNAVSQETLDNAVSLAQQNEAEVESLRAVIARKKITAPFSGRTGIRQVNVGQYISAGTPVVPLHSLDPMYADFTLPQQEVPHIAVGQSVNVKIDAFGERIFPGKISAINPQIDSSTRNVSVRATIPNPDQALRPGMFAEIKVVLPISDTVIAVPATSIHYAPYGDAVYVIEQMKDPKGQEYSGVRQQIVKLGHRQGDQIAVLEGLKPGEQIATSGVFKLRPGAAVSVNNSFSPGNSLAPKPPNT